MASIHNLFPQYLYSDKLNISDGYNEEIKNEIFKILENIPKGEESVTDYFSLQTVKMLNNPVFVPLFSLIKEHVTTFCQHIGYTQKLYIRDVWFSITYPGQFHRFHNHQTTMAGVYYVQASKPMNLNFISSGHRIINCDHMENLESKKLILFDGSLTHGFTAVQEGSDPKITIAFNLST